MQRTAILSTAALAGVFLLGAEPRTDVFIAKNLVSDLPGHAERRDRNLANPWGVSFAPNGPFWISDNHTGVVTVYNSKGEPFPADHPLVVTVPPPGNGAPPSAPTGQVFHSGPGFEVGPGHPALFIFATEDGTISGWNPQANATQAILKVDNSGAGAVYKGLAFASTNVGSFLYATNFFAGQIEVFDSNYSKVSLSLTAFQDGQIPLGFAPFNIQNIGGNLWVTYAMQNAEKHDDMAGPGNGFVDVFDSKGVLLRRFAQQGALNSPWGIAMAPANFGAFSGAVLIGNFGDGRISAYDQTGAFLGQLREPSGRALEIDGLWALIFGNGGQGGKADLLYYTAGIDHEEHGWFGQIKPQHP